MYFTEDAIDSLVDDLLDENLDEAVYPVRRVAGGRFRVDRSRDITNNSQALQRATRPRRAGVWVEGDVAAAQQVANDAGFSQSVVDNRHLLRDGSLGQPHVHGTRGQSPRSSHIFYGPVPPGDFADFDAFEDALVDALDEENTDEFFRRLARGIGRVARGIGRGIGQVARVVGPIASLIPLPFTQAIGRVANIAGRLLADGADEFEAIDALVDLAEEEDLWDAAAPAIATMAVHGVMPQAARLPPATRQQIVRATTQTAQNLAQRQGTQAARVLPAVVQTAQRVARQQQLPAQALPQVIRQVGNRLSRNPQMVNRLLRSATSPPHRCRCGNRAQGRPIAR
jgi:hypothetical protein